jgi:hypothetical protein
MAVRRLRGAGLRRAARGRAGFVALACAVYLAAGFAATWPAVKDARHEFLSGGAPAHGEASPGDHLQTLYHWWLVGHQLEHGHAPWLDPYSFRPEADAQPNFPGWPFGFLFWPLSAAFGLVVAWNLMQLLVYVLAGLAACAWLRELGLRRASAVAGGLAFAIAPYRVEQSVGHLLGPISVLLAVSLWAFERARRRRNGWWLVVSGAAIASIPLSGQVHLALGAIPFYLLYTFVRARRRDGGVHLHRSPLAIGSALGAIVAIGAGILVRQTVIVGSTQSGGRSLDEVRIYSAHWSDFVTRHVDHARSEQFVFLGWATPVVALVGLAVLLHARRFGLAAALGLGALVPILLAVGTHLPLYSALWHALPPFRFPRVPERLMPIACLCIAALVAIALARTRSAVVAALAVALLFVDLHARAYGRSAPGDPAAVADVAPGRLLELPVFDPGVHYGSVYLLYDTSARRQRPGGYSTTAPNASKSLARRLERLNCGDWSGGTAALLERLGVKSIAFHRGLFEKNSAVPDRSAFARRGLARHGWSPRQGSGPVRLYQRSRRRARAPLPPAPPVFCQGWFGETPAVPGRAMSETHAPFWIYSAGPLRLRFAPSPLRLRFTVDERPERGPVLQLGRPGWHVVTVEAPQLLAGANGKKVGARLLSLATAPLWIHPGGGRLRPPP